MQSFEAGVEDEDSSGKIEEHCLKQIQQDVCLNCKVMEQLVGQKKL